MKVPDFEPDLGISTAVDRSRRLYSPMLGPVDSFKDTVNLPENQLLEAEVIK